MIDELPDDAPTDRHWIFNDRVGQQYMLYIPNIQRVVTATLDWKADDRSAVYPVGRYKIDLGALEAGGYVRLKDIRYFLRFQRTKERIEIAINRTSKALDFGRIRKPQRQGVLDGGPGEP